ncbi:MAG: TIGR03667 family PPOX class F420-dependent oxidoreductase [Ktedonobacterales bacterium]
MSTVLPDASTPFGERVARRLREEPVIWLTTVADDGTPQPNPVWFLWDQNEILVYNMSGAKRLEHIAHNSRVSLNFDGNGRGGDIIVITGQARLSQDPPAHQFPAFVEKYNDFIARSFKAPENFASRYPTPIRITPTKVRGH